MKKILKDILKELKENASFVFLVTLIGVLLFLTIRIYLKKNISEDFFYITHTVHIFIFGVLISAAFFKHKGKTINSFVLGAIISIILATLSDIIFPFIGGILFNLTPEFHLPLIKNPFIIISTSLIGGLIGIVTKFTKIPFFVQVFLSVFASLFYLLLFTEVSDLRFILFAVIVFVGSLLTCCIRNLILPPQTLKKH